MRALLVFAVAALVGGACAPMAQPASPAPSLAGQSASTITSRLGPPEQQQVESRTLYVWKYETRAPATPMPATRVSYAAGRPNTVDTIAYPDPPEMEACTLRAFVDGAARIVSTAWDGSRAACFDMQQKLATKG